MTYLVSILRRAQKEIEDLPTTDAARVRAAIAGLAHPYWRLPRDL